MSFPLEAFKYTSAANVAPGTIVADERGNWYMVARKIGATANQAVRLNRNDNDGALGDLLSTIDERVFAVSAPYTTSIRAEDLFDLRRTQDGPYPGAVMLAEPLAIFTFDNERHLIGLDGHEIDENTVHTRRARIMKWSVWLVDQHGRQVGDRPLVEVDATAQ
ncbi:hypothetical protein [uncultured Stenotrophomonas sp.]|uniref:hypothetical protein n=1 Tax=uncultured Stenotrophomonas sp. TaxID=165438 RepID=UPI0028E19E6C|nr:hypothetical protein [uncultured Stenotrophomonas sp.]